MTNDDSVRDSGHISQEADGKNIKANGIGIGIFQGVNEEENPMNIKLT